MEKPTSQAEIEEIERRAIAAAENDPDNYLSDAAELRDAARTRRGAERIAAGEITGYGPFDFGTGPVKPGKLPKTKPVPKHKWD